jgi:hypothetical protein
MRGHSKVMPHYCCLVICIGIAIKSSTQYYLRFASKSISKLSFRKCCIEPDYYTKLAFQKHHGISICIIRVLLDEFKASNRFVINCNPSWLQLYLNWYIVIVLMIFSHFLPFLVWSKWIIHVRFKVMGNYCSELHVIASFLLRLTDLALCHKTSCRWLRWR